MESTFLAQREILIDLLQNILRSINQLKEWNSSYKDAEDMLTSPDGMKTLSADCMLIQAIGEGLKQVDKYSDGKLLPLQPQIPWKQVKGMRDHIAHGYFDINVDLVWDVITEELNPLANAVEWLLDYLLENE